MLDRLSFGPTPGQAAEVEQEGVEFWFQQQLHPDRIPDAALDLRLAAYPAMQLSQAELIERFPTQAMLRQYNAGRLALPGDALERAVYADAALQYAEKREDRAAAKAGEAVAPSRMAPTSSAALATSPPHDRDDLLMESRNRLSPAPAGLPPEAPIVRQAPRGPSLSEESARTPDGLGEEQHLLSLAPEARFSALAALTPDEMLALQATMKGAEKGRLTQGLTPRQRELTVAMQSPERVVAGELPAVRLLRDVYSQRQLQAVMTDFWLNHFNIYLHKNQNEPYLLPAFARDAVLPNALGHFEDLLVATAKSPAMLVYLDNAESVGPDSRAGERVAASEQLKGTGSNVAVPAKIKGKGARGINENYARELMELQTIGVNGGYTQQDVIEVARCFTGWGVERPEQGGAFTFNPNRHEPGDKVVLGHVIHEGGMQEGLEVLHLLAVQPATAQFLSRQLAERFVSDDPPQALVDRMSATFLHSDGDMAQVLTTMFHSPEFWSPVVYRTKVKTPLEFAVSAVRASGAEVSQPQGLVQSLAQMGMPLYEMKTPNGYSWQAEDWVSSSALLTRMNFALVLSGNRLAGVRVDWTGLLGGAADSAAVPEAKVQEQLEVTLLGQPAAAQTHQAALAGASVPGVQGEAERSLRSLPVTSGQGALGGKVTGKGRERGGGAISSAAAAGSESPLATAAGLLLGSPDFQKR